MLQHSFGSDSSLKEDANENHDVNLRQFLAALHCVSEMTKVDVTAQPLVRCGVVPVVVRLLHHILPNNDDLIHNSSHKSNRKLEYLIEVEVMSYLWSILANLSNNDGFLNLMIAEPDLITVMHKESAVGLYKCRAYVAHLALHISKHLRNEDVVALPDQMLSLDTIVLTVKSFLSNPWGREGHNPAVNPKGAMQTISLALLALINLAENVVASRALIISNDLLKILRETITGGQEQSRADVFSAILLLYVLSKEEALVIKLLDNDVHSSLVAYATYVEEISRMMSKPATSEKKKNPRRFSISGEALPLNDGKVFAQRCGDLIVATLMNISLKRAVLGETVLPLLLNLLRNCKTSRVMWIARCLANISAHPRAKKLLVKEPRLIPAITSVMRSGSEEAEKAQLYCSSVICNVLAQSLPRSMVDRMMKAGEVTDLVVVTLLRVSAHSSGPTDGPDANRMSFNQQTKIALGKALFNLLSRLDTRFEMVHLGVFDALVDLSKIENVEILELSMRTIYNVSSEASVYSDILLKSGVPSLLCSVLTSFGHGTPLTTHQGAKPTHKIKLIAAKALANISFDINLSFAVSKCLEISDALYTISCLNSQEAVYCATSIIYNLFIPETSDMRLNGLRDSIVRAASNNILNRSRRFKSNEGDKENKVTVTFLTVVLDSFLETTATPILCGQLAASTLCNMSLSTVFHEQCSKIALATMIKVLSSPRCALETKVDAVRFVYNIVGSAVFPESKVLSIENGIVSGIASVLKLMTPEEESTMGLISSIVLEICGEKERVYQLVMEGIAKSFIRLAKVEVPSIKLSIARAILRISQVAEAVAKLLLQGDGVDVLFWLTIHDCLGDFPPILANVSRTLKNFALDASDASNLVKEERLMSVLKVLAKGDNEDILWQTAAAVLNILGVESNRAIMVKRGVIPLIFTLAKGGGGSGFTSVRYICSACLHTIPDSLPDMKDPSVLPLVLCLLDINETDQSKGDPDARATDEIHKDGDPPSLVEPAVVSGSCFSHFSRSFDFENSPGAEVTPPLSWITMTCDVDSTFSPVRLAVMTEEDIYLVGASAIDLNPVLRSMAIKVDSHHRLLSSCFGDFKSEPNDEGSSHANKDAAPALKAETTESLNDIPPSELNRAAATDNRGIAGDVRGSAEKKKRKSVRTSANELVAASPSEDRPSTSGKRASTPIATLDSVSVIRKHEYSPTRPPRSGKSASRL